MQSKEYEKHWRFRITRLTVYFLNDQKEIITEGLPPNDPMDESFGMRIIFPSTYHDINWDEKPQMFARGQIKSCTSSKSGNTTQACKASDLRSVSPNGTFIFKLRHQNDLDMKSFHGLKISIGGTFLSFD